MIDTLTWNDPLFKESLKYVAILMFILGAILFPIRKKNTNFKTGWAIWLSWLLALPVLVFLLAIEGSWSLAGFTILSIFALREFFQITGIYHQHWFVWISYIFTYAIALVIHFNNSTLYNLSPMLLLFSLSLIPIFKNEYKSMLKYISLSLIGFILISWAFLHLAWLVQWQYGARHLLFIILLTEICDTTNLGFSKAFGRTVWFNKIAPKRTLEGFGFSVIITLILAFALRHLLPEQTEAYWVSAGLVASMAGGMGDIVLSAIRRDIHVKDRSSFILGRGGVLDRMDRLIFVAPIYYYVLKALEFFQL